MSNEPRSDEVKRLRQELTAREERAPTLAELSGADPEGDQAATGHRAEAAYWRQKYEEARIRLGKLWVAYRDLEAELDLRREEMEVVAERKAAALLQEHEAPELLAIAAPDGLEIVTESSQREVEPGRGTHFPVVLTNRTDEPVAVQLEAGEVEEGWKLLITAEEVELEPSSSQTVHVILRSPSQVDPGDQGRAQVVVGWGEERRELQLQATVVQPGTLHPASTTTDDGETEPGDRSVAEGEIEPGATPATAAEEPTLVVPEPEAEPLETREPGDDPFGDIHPVIDIEGIGEVYSARLEEIGIVDTRRLWSAEPAELSEAVGRSTKVVARWQAQAELMAIDGIGPQYAELLVRSGIESIEDLAAADPEPLLETLKSTQARLEIRIQGSPLSMTLAERLVASAQEHTPAP